MDPETEALAKLRAKALGFSTFSGYVNALINRDLVRQEDIVISSNTGISRNTGIVQHGAGHNASQNVTIHETQPPRRNTPKRKPKQS